MFIGSPCHADGRLSLVTIGCVDQQQTLVKAITFQLVTQSTSEETENDYRLYAFLTVWQFWMELAEAENRGPPIRVRDSGERRRRRRGRSGGEGEEAIRPTRESLLFVTRQENHRNSINLEVELESLHLLTF